MKKKFRFTVKELTALEAQAKRARYYDTAIDGLIIEVTPAGRKVFRVYKRPKGGKAAAAQVTLGTFPELSIEQARTQAREKLNQIALGVNPNEQARAEELEGVTLQKVFDDYLKVKQLRESTVKGYEKSIRLYFAKYANKPLAVLTEDAVKGLHSHITAGTVDGMRAGSKAQADYCMRLLRALFNFAKYEYRGQNNKILFPENPVKILSHQRAWNNVERRNTYIRPHQFKEFFEVLSNKREEFELHRNGFGMTVCDLVMFATLTGLRRSELFDLKWDTVDLSAKSFYVGTTKNGQPLELPISPYTGNLLARRQKQKDEFGYVFNVANAKGKMAEPRKVLAKLNEALSFDFTLHDLRRTFATVAESIGVGNYMLKRLLNHKTRRDDVTAGYTILTPEELREPAKRIEVKMLKLAGITTATTEEAVSPGQLSEILEGLDSSKKAELLKLLVGSM